MTKRILCFTCIFLFFSVLLFAQADPFSGTWHAHSFLQKNSSPIDIKILVASAEKNQLYPAQITMQSDSFAAVYNVLLVKRNIRQLAIGRQKIPVSEKPFSIGNLSVLLNGTLDLSRDMKGISYLTLNRLQTKQYGVEIPPSEPGNNSGNMVFNQLKFFLKDAEIQFKKIDPEPWIHAYTDTILRSPATGYYFGILDTMHVNTKFCNLNFPGNKKTSNGIVSVLLNGNTVIDQADLGYKKPAEETILDTGLNLIIFYAENYGKSAATTGKLELVFDKKKIALDFADKKNTAATFIVARIYYYPPKEVRSPAEDELSKLSPEFSTINNDNVFYYPDTKRMNASKLLPKNTTKENTLLRDVKLLGNVESSSRQITLAIWDDAVEDGDSISLSINGNWVVQGLAVKKRPQFIIVTLEPGKNKITFIADNLGSIVPNTSVLEIIDGKKRKSFMIDTNLSQNNLINIMYELRPGD